mmetsp:Transcript_16379/g.25448  ORF Transcript_16379/g.25448 Transcript_16379/m.25448 type:complete len:99 (-) Transcript_16379:335-631(-)
MGKESTHKYAAKEKKKNMKRGRGKHREIVTRKMKRLRSEKIRNKKANTIEARTEAKIEHQLEEQNNTHTNRLEKCKTTVTNQITNAVTQSMHRPGKST